MARRTPKQPEEAPDAIEIGEDEEVVAQRHQDMVEGADTKPATATPPTPTSEPVGTAEERLGPGVDPKTSGASLVDKGLVPSDQVLSGAPDLESRMAHENTTPAVSTDDPNQAPKPKAKDDK